MSSAEGLDSVISAVRSIALSLPESYEEVAWVGTRWRIRRRTFAHVVPIESGRPAGYARAAGTAGPCWVLTFRSAGQELDALRHSGSPFFAPPWRADEVGMLLDVGTDLDEVAELVTESFCLLAPKTLTASVLRAR